MSDQTTTPEAPRPKRRPLSAKKKLVFGLVTCVGLLGVAEVFFQIRTVLRQRRRPSLPRTLDPYRDMVNTPGHHERPRKHQTIDINALGMRSPEVGPKQPGVTRILAIGGSTTFGLYTSANDKTWPLQLQKALRAAGKQVEVFNAGAPAWTLRTSLNNLELTAWKIHPDIVICYHAYNDLMENLDPVYWSDSKVDDVKKLYRPHAMSLLEHSELYCFIRSRLRDPHDAFVEKKDVLEEEGIAAYERNLRRLVRRCREEKAKLILCTYPTAYRPTYEQSKKDEVPGLDMWYGALCPLSYPKLLEGMERYNATIRKVAAEEKLPLAELAKTLPKDVKYYKSPLHHSDAGEAEVAGRIAKAILHSKLLDGL